MRGSKFRSSGLHERPGQDGTDDDHKAQPAQECDLSGEQKGSPAPAESDLTSPWGRCGEKPQDEVSVLAYITEALFVATRTS